MRIVLLARSLGVGGAERQLILLARGLRDAGHGVDVVLFYGNGALEHELAQAGIAPQILGKATRWEVVRFLVRLARTIRQARPDVVYSFLVVPNVLTALLRWCWPGVGVVWGVRSSAMDLRRYDRFARLAFGLSRLLSRLPDLIISNSEAGRRDHVALGYPAARLTVVPNAIDTERFQHSQDGRRALRAAWGVDDSQVVVGVVARLDPKKGHDVALDAFARLAEPCPALQLVVVGPGPDTRREQLRERAARLGLADRVWFDGDRDDMTAVYSAIDLLCLPSLFGEGFPNVVGEAMACETPAVVTDVGDAAAVVGDIGVVVPPGDDAALARAIEDLASWRGDRPSLGSAARARVVELWSVERLVSSTVAALEIA